MKHTFLHISDLHFLRDYAGKGGDYADILAGMTPPLEQLESLLRGCKARPEFIALTGDLCEHGDENDYRALRTALKGIFGEIPVFATPGNHDCREGFYRGFLGREPDAEPHFEIHELGWMRVICLDSSDAGHPDGIITKKSCELLRAALAQKDEPALILTHHHLIEGQFELPAAQYPPELTDVIADSSAEALLNGHTHHFHLGEFAQKPCFTAGSLSFYGENRVGDVEFLEAPELSLFTYDGRLRCERITGSGEPRLLGVLRAAGEAR